MTRHQRTICIPALASVVLVAAACSDDTPLTANRITPDVAASYNPAQCGALFTIQTTEEDPDLAPFGIPTSITESNDVCESWTGNDYVLSETSLGESDAVPAFPEDVVRTDFASGQLTPMSGSGSPLQSPESVDPTAFALVDASPEEIAASYDDPYYAVYSEECPPENPYCHEQQSVAVPDSVGASGPAPQQAYTRHGITRRGVRALLESANETAPDASGERRFTRPRAGGTVTYTLDPATQLIMAEEYVDDSTHTIARHSWTRTARGYVRAETIIDDTSTRAGRRETTRTTIRITKLQIHGTPVL